MIKNTDGKIRRTAISATPIPDPVSLSEFKRVIFKRIYHDIRKHYISNLTVSEKYVKSEEIF